jgi:hypothetical protein
MTHLTTRLAVRALFTIVMQTEVHATGRPIFCGEGTDTSCVYFKGDMFPYKTWKCSLDEPGYVVVCAPADEPEPCATGHEQACQQRDHGASPYQGRGR